MGEEVDILGKGTKFKLFSIVNEVPLYLAPCPPLWPHSQETCSAMLDHTGVPAHLRSHQHTCAPAASKWGVCSSVSSPTTNLFPLYPSTNPTLLTGKPIFYTLKNY